MEDSQLPAQAIGTEPPANHEFLVERIINDQTGKTISLYDTEHPNNTDYVDPDDLRWAVCCEDHDVYESFEDFAEARSAVRQPGDFCTKCAVAKSRLWSMGQWVEGIGSPAQQSALNDAELEAEASGHDVLTWRNTESNEKGTLFVGQCAKCHSQWFVTYDGELLSPDSDCSESAPAV